MSCAELVLDVDTKTQRVVLKKKVALVNRKNPEICVCSWTSSGLPEDLSPPLHKLLQF